MDGMLCGKGSLLSSKQMPELFFADSLPVVSIPNVNCHFEVGCDPLKEEAKQNYYLQTDKNGDGWLFSREGTQADFGVPQV